MRRSYMEQVSEKVQTGKIRADRAHFSFSLFQPIAESFRQGDLIASLHVSLRRLFLHPLWLPPSLWLRLALPAEWLRPVLPWLDVEHLSTDL